MNPTEMERRLPAAEFGETVVAILVRHCRQNDLAAPGVEELAGLAARLHGLIAERGLPRALGPAEQGAPGGMSDEVADPLVARVLGDAPARLAGPVKQLVKACFYPEFTQCRDSFRERTAEGVCRRQEANRARARVSGAHCVDCPHWTELTPERHREFLGCEWHAGPREFEANREIFLPEDFRELRRQLHAGARRT